MLGSFSAAEGGATRDYRRENFGGARRLRRLGREFAGHCGGSAASAREPETMTMRILLPAERSASIMFTGMARSVTMRSNSPPRATPARRRRRTRFRLGSLGVQGKRVKFAHSRIVLHDSNRGRVELLAEGEIAKSSVVAVWYFMVSHPFCLTHHSRPRVR